MNTFMNKIGWGLLVLFVFGLISSAVLAAPTPPPPPPPPTAGTPPPGGTNPPDNPRGKCLDKYRKADGSCMNELEKEEVLKAEIKAELQGTVDELAKEEAWSKYWPFLIAFGLINIGELIFFLVLYYRKNGHYETRIKASESAAEKAVKAAEKAVAAAEAAPGEVLEKVRAELAAAIAATQGGSPPTT